jgi:hypothetical protein
VAGSGAGAWYLGPTMQPVRTQERANSAPLLGRLALRRAAPVNRGNREIFSIGL